MSRPYHSTKSCSSPTNGASSLVTLMMLSDYLRGKILEPAASWSCVFSSACRSRRRPKRSRYRRARSSATGNTAGHGCGPSSVARTGLAAGRPGRTSCLPARKLADRPQSNLPVCGREAPNASCPSQNSNRRLSRKPASERCDDTVSDTPSDTPLIFPSRARSGLKLVSARNEREGGQPPTTE